MQMVNTLRRGVAIVGAAALVCSPLLLAPGTASAKPTAVSRAATPSLTATLTAKSIKVSGPSRLRPGRVKLSVRGKGVVELAMFARGYDADDFAADLAKVGAKNDMKALKHALANTTILGGFEGGGSGTIVLPKAGSYTPFSLGERGVVIGDPITVSGAKRASTTPSTDGRIIAKPGLSWGGSSTLPAKGRLLFKNKASTGIPHFIAMSQVVEGTTTDQVLEYFQSGEETPPPWGLPASMETGSISPGKSITVNYDLPAGQYVVLCFFPDPEMGGMPHAFMGMLEMIHLT